MTDQPAPPDLGHGERRRRRFQASAQVAATPEQLFARLDDQTRLAAHMERSSTMMGGGRMTFTFDHGRGREVGSHIRMAGSAFGIPLSVEEAVTRREPPWRKAWRTVGSPRLLIIGGYAMGYGIEAAPLGSRLTVWIDYDLPANGIGRWLGWLFAWIYARWCVRRMITDAAA